MDELEDECDVTEPRVLDKNRIKVIDEFFGDRPPCLFTNLLLLAIITDLSGFVMFTGLVFFNNSPRQFLTSHLIIILNIISHPL